MKTRTSAIKNVPMWINKNYRIVLISVVAIFAVKLALNGIASISAFLSNLLLFDRIMLVILAVSLGMKLCRSIVIPIYIKYLEFNSKRECRFLIQDEEENFKCENLRYVRRNFEDCGQQCSRKIGKLCWGFKALSVKDNNGEAIVGEDAVYSSPTIIIVMGVVDWVIEFSTVILLIRTLVGIGGE